MRKGLMCVLLFLAGVAANAQKWEVGVIGGVGYSPLVDLKSNTTSGSAGLANGTAFGIHAGEDTYKYVSGEVNYLYRLSDFKLQSGNTTVRFDGHTHLITGDFLFHFTPKGSRIRPYVSVGGGIEILQGTGSESAFQPLGNLAALTATREVLPVGEVGAGVKIQISHRVRVRLQVRDYISQVPKDVITTAPGVSFQSSVMHDLAATAGVALTW